MATHTWNRQIAEAYDATSAVMFAPEILGPTVETLFGHARGGPALEFAVGTGRVALPLAQRSIPVHGIELSPYMAEQLSKKPGAEAVPVTVGDMATTRIPGSFSLVYLVWNSIMNVTTQDEQVAVFINASAHLAPGGCFVVEVAVPQVHGVVPGSAGRVFALQPDHVGVETFDGGVGQIAWSHHWTAVDGRLVHHAAPYRYVWPSELDLMARLAGLELRDRSGGWRHEPFSAESQNQVVVYEKP